MNSERTPSQNSGVQCSAGQQVVLWDAMLWVDAQQTGRQVSLWQDSRVTPSFQRGRGIHQRGGEGASNKRPPATRLDAV